MPEFQRIEDFLGVTTKCRLPNSPNFGKFLPRLDGDILRSNDSSFTGNPEFWTTCWSAVLLSAQSEVPGSDLARDEIHVLCEALIAAEGQMGL